MSHNLGKLKPYAVLQYVIHGRVNQILLRGLLAKHEKLYLYLQTSSMFPTLPEGNAEYYILFENCIVGSKNFIGKSRLLSKHTFFKSF